MASKSGAAAEELTRPEEHAQGQAAPCDCTTANGASAKKQGVMWLADAPTVAAAGWNFKRLSKDLSCSSHPANLQHRPW